MRSTELEVELKQLGYHAEGTIEQDVSGSRLSKLQYTAKRLSSGHIVYESQLDDTMLIVFDTNYWYHEKFFRALDTEMEERGGSHMAIPLAASVLSKLVPHQG
jgi:hypothetical protein